MSKWIRDRLRRRRKKTGGSAKQGENPPPLQPNFITNELPPRVPEKETAADAQRESGNAFPGVKSGASPAKHRVEAAAEKRVAAEAEDQPAEGAPPAGEAGGAEGGRPGGKRRRRRGRRGRGGRGTAAGSHPAPLQPAYPEAPEAAAPVGQTRAAEPAAATVAHPRHAAAPAAQPRKPKGVVILAIGLPGSGKSTWFKRRGAVPLSSDVIRSMLFDDVTEQRFQDLVFSTLRSLLRARLVARMPLNYVDATNLSPHDRRVWIKMAHDFGYEVQAVFFDVPTEVCMERNQRRNRVVPEDVMQRMAGKLRPPKFEEGFSKITVVRVKQTAEEPSGDGEPPDADE
ncbi:MAG TPA: ATP-binding protein [Terriglobales bacterium]|nr:ATP-binding protein [Terriglobales bacterium]